MGSSVRHLRGFIASMAVASCGFALTGCADSPDEESTLAQSIAGGQVENGYPATG